MRILQLHARHREAGGEDSVVDAEAAVLRAAGHEVVQHQAANPERTLPSACTFAQAVWNQGAARAVARLVTTQRPDVAHVHNTWYALSPSVVVTLSRLGVPVVVTLHNYRLHCANGLLFREGRPCEECLTGGSLPGLRHRCYRGSWATSGVAALTIGIHRRMESWTGSVDRFIVLSDFARDRSAAGGLPPAKVVVRENFTEDPGPRPYPPSASREVLLVGRMAVEKGLPLAMAAWDRAKVPGLRLAVVGDGALRPVFEQAAPLGVSFVGRLGRDEVVRRMLSARGLVFPTLWYEAGTAMVLIEAMAAGLPYVATDQAGAAPEGPGLGAVTRAVTGDVEALARGIRLLADDARVDGAGIDGRGVYEQRYTPVQGLATLEAVYAAAVADRRAGLDRSNGPPPPLPSRSEASG